jgi:hypothetical protein
MGTTRSALVDMKYPKQSATFVKQANMTTGPQQVNNTCANTPSCGGKQSRTENIESEPNKLLEANHGQRLDRGTQAQAGRANQEVATLGAVHRPDIAWRKAAGQQECLDRRAQAAIAGTGAAGESGSWPDAQAGFDRAGSIAPATPGQCKHPEYMRVSMAFVSQKWVVLGGFPLYEPVYILKVI